MPECDAAYIASYLFEVGPVMAGGMGEVPITHGEIRAWMYNIGIELDSWEVRAVKHLSSVYLTESQAATAQDREAPWGNAPYIKAAAAAKMQRAIEKMVRE